MHHLCPLTQFFLTYAVLSWSTKTMCTFSNNCPSCKTAVMPCRVDEGALSALHLSKRKTSLLCSKHSVSCLTLMLSCMYAPHESGHAGCHLYDSALCCAQEFVKFMYLCSFGLQNLQPCGSSAWLFDRSPLSRKALDSFVCVPACCTSCRRL